MNYLQYRQCRYTRMVLVQHVPGHRIGHDLLQLEREGGIRYGDLRIELKRQRTE